MTTKDFKEMLLSIGFHSNVDSPDVYTKNYGDLIDVLVKVDFKSRKIHYPDSIKVHDETTSNFEHPENFVVCECVCRLLEKGYRPEHIELEKRWNLGHEAKGGKADICVYDADGQKMFLIIECKTYGTEYNKEKKQTLLDGGQLFSYWQQERSTQWLALYAVDFREGKRIHEVDVISCKDDANVIELAKKDDSYRLYKDAASNLELYEVWDETYNKNWCPDLIFSEDSTAYQINIRPLRKRDLKEFKAEDKIVNRFEEILRHNNVSDKENAFNRLTALFICKMVDEIDKTDDEELEFQYKEGTDTYETLQDRLQKLHKQGMQDFMRETIFYISNDYPDQLLAQYAKQKRQAMINDLRNTIRILKFYSNNDFSFKDVHNEELFLQNGKVLVEVVKLFERYRIVYNSKEQFLGDLFEQLLNKGFKQNEGQFFTPIPITRFIWDSLPLESLIHNVGKYSLPKVIDFACGAGHFLTEAVEAINDYLDRIKQPDLKKDNAWVEKSIFGIEKDYRLARVSKISLFMNGAGFGNVIFGDGLDNYPDKGISAESFDVLVANPPYSVAAFKQHFKPKNNKFELLGRISNAGSEIEVLFVERISQLLKPKGLAAVILPASIFSNSSSSYIGARESLLENFKIRAIVQLGSKTFGATGTNTVVVFLEKYDEPPKRKELVKDSALSILGNEDITDWEDQEIFDAYLAKIEVSKEDYKSFCSQKQLFEHWRQHSYFGQYVKSFEDWSETRKKKTQKNFKKLPEDQQAKILTADFYQYVLAKENEKIRFFALVYNQVTLIVTAPTGNDEQKEFLGYDWSNRKGAEGILILNPGGKLYDNKSRSSDNTIAAAIRGTFMGLRSTIPDLDKYLAWYRLQDLIDFSGVVFDKQIKTSVSQKIAVLSKYSTVPLGAIAIIEKGQSITQADTMPGSIKVVAGGIDFAYKHNKANRDAGIITVSASGANAGYVNYWDEPIFASDCTTILGKTKIETLFIFYYLKSIQTYLLSLSHGSSQPHVYGTDLEPIQIPLPPLEIQKTIVKGCTAIDSACEKARQTIQDQQTQIEHLVDSVFDSQYQMRSIESVSKSVEYGSSAKSVKSGKVPVVRMGNVQNGRIDWSDLVYSNDDTEISKYQLRKYDVLFNRTNSPELVGKSCIYLGEQPAIFAGYLIRVNYKSEEINPFYLCYILNSKRIREHGFSVMAKSVNQANINGSLLKQYQIPVPRLEDQQAIVNQILKKESLIKEAQAVLNEATTKRQAVLNKYLQ